MISEMFSKTERLFAIMFSMVVGLGVCVAVSYSGKNTEDPAARYEKRQREEGDRRGNNMTYFRDPRTGLCFASYGSNPIPIGHVPYEAVKDYLLNPPEPPENKK